MDRNLIHCKFARMTIEKANRLLITSLSELYEEREAASISALVMDRITGLTKGQRFLHKADLLLPPDAVLFQQYLEELLKNRPVQYVLGEAWFGSLPFYVDENVLIPRPETEELANWLLGDAEGRSRQLTVLDIGTGSGCIPVYLHSKRPDFNLSALDISETALNIAKRNNASNHTNVQFFIADIRDQAKWTEIVSPDLIISNPPYIPEKQKENLEKNVKNFEPPLALFVPDEDPIMYYKIIADFAIQKLKAGGALFLEIHHDFAGNVMNWFTDKGFVLELKKDLFGNNRMIKAWR
jgi:release factor glutamine methyltransferase